MEHTNTLCGQNLENLYIETGGTLDIKGLNTGQLTTIYSITSLSSLSSSLLKQNIPIDLTALFTNMVRLIR
jgi:hypothetical protein